MVVSPSVCKLASFFIGVAEIWYMSAPVGECDHCCPRDDSLDIEYRLFTRSNPTEYQLIPIDLPNTLSRTSFNISNPTVFYLTGFSESTNGISVNTVKNAYLKSGDYNFIAIDWTRLIVFPWYVSAVRNTHYMGKRLAEFIDYLDGSGVRASSLHVIGFSLGAHAAGFAGKELRRRGITLGRITGLDPASVGFITVGKEERLAKGDAAFVDVIHTNPYVFGHPESLGDVDFYSNHGGPTQPGCFLDQLIHSKEFKYLYGCSHVRAWRIYAESVGSPLGFPATHCRDWTSATSNCQFQTHGYLGIRANSKMKGDMYLKTNRYSPFARNGP